MIIKVRIKNEVKEFHFDTLAETLAFCKGMIISSKNSDIPVEWETDLTEISNEKLEMKKKTDYVTFFNLIRSYIIDEFGIDIKEKKQERDFIFCRLLFLEVVDEIYGISFEGVKGKKRDERPFSQEHVSEYLNFSNRSVLSHYFNTLNLPISQMFYFYYHKLKILSELGYDYKEKKEVLDIMEKIKQLRKKKEEIRNKILESIK